MAWSNPKRFNFRSTAAYVSDGTDETYVLPSTTYPTTRTINGESVTFGWESGSPSGADRSTSTPYSPELSGINYSTAASGTDYVFRVDLPASGTYKAIFGAGDASAGNEAWHVLEDDTSVLLTVGSISTFVPGGNFVDASSTQDTAADWQATTPNGGTLESVTFATTICRVVMKGGVSNANVLAHFGLIPPTGGGTTYTKVEEDDVVVVDLVSRIIKRLKEESIEVVDPSAHRFWIQTEDDALSVSDLLAKTAKKLREDDVALIDGFIKAVIPAGSIHIKVLDEALVLTDLRSRSSVRIQDDPIVLVDEFVKLIIPGGGQIHTVVTSDAVVIVDLADQRYWIHRGLSTDNLVLSDLEARLLQRIRAVSDGIVVADGTARVRLSQRMLAELLQLQDEAISRYLPAVLYEVRIRIGAMPSPNVLGGYH